MRIASERIFLSISILFGSDRLLADGYAWEFLDSSKTDAIREACEPILASSEKKFGIRDATSRSAELGALVEECLLPIARKYLHPHAFLVRSTLFDKPSDANWAVPWHQDVTIEVEERHDAEGFGPWSVKDSLVSVQPPTSVLAEMLTLRLHLDPTDEENGALLVEPSSHLHGKLPIHEIIAESPIVCECRAGEILMMRPLLFHSSKRSTSAKPRRVLHLDFACRELPSPLQWRTVIPRESRANSSPYGEFL